MEDLRLTIPQPNQPVPASGIVDRAAPVISPFIKEMKRVPKVAFTDSDDVEIGGVFTPSSTYDKDILNTVILPEYTKDIKNTAEWRRCWRSTSDITSVVSKLMVLVASGVAFAAGYWQIPVISYIAGTVSLVGAGLETFSKHAKEKYTQKQNALNLLANNLHIAPLPDAEDVPKPKTTTKATAAGVTGVTGV